MDADQWVDVMALDSVFADLDDSARTAVRRYRTLRRISRSKRPNLPDSYSEQSDHDRAMDACWITGAVIALVLAALVYL